MTATFPGGGGGGGAPTGPAGGALAGAYPNPGFAVDMATQGELDTHALLTTGAHNLGALLAAKIDTAVLDTDGTLTANSDAKLATQKAVKTYADQLLAASDAMVFKNVIDCSANPNYPAADRGHVYVVSVAGKIGGAAGVNVEAGDELLCKTDGTAAGTQAAVGAQWAVVQTNIDGAVTGPAAAVSGNLVSFNGVGGKVVQDSGLALDTDATLAANSDARLPSQKAVKGYVDTATGLLIPKSLIDAKGDLLVGTADNTVARKAVGADGFSLVADSSKADGLDWVDRAPARTIPPGWFIGPRIATRSTLALSGIARIGVWVPVDAEAQPIDLLRWEVTVLGDAASVLTVALYRLRSPGSLSVDRVAITGAISSTTTGVKDAAISTATLPRGVYLAVMEPTGHSATPPTVRSSSAGGGGHGIYSGDVSEVVDPRGGVTAAALANAGGLPASFALVAQVTRQVGPIIYARAV